METLANSLPKMDKFHTQKVFGVSYVINSQD